MNRRDFLRNARTGIGSAAALGLGALGGWHVSRAIGKTANPRYLINCVVTGGIDGFYHSSAYGPGELRGFPNLKQDSSTGHWTTRETPTGEEDRIFTERYLEQDLFQHPLAQDRLLGPGMRIFSNQDLQRMAIVNGLITSGGHGDGNYILNTGAISPYSACFSSHIAAKLGSERVLALPYTQAANSLYTRFGTRPDPLGVPVVIDGDMAWKSMTTPSSAELADGPTGGRKHILDAVSGISTSLAKISGVMPQTKRIINGYLENFLNSEIVSKSNWGSSQLFQDILAKYKNAPASTLQALLGQSSQLLNTRMQPSDFIKRRTDWNTSVNKIAFGFAIAEFLVVNDLSAVVDIPGIAGDWHAENYNHFTNQMITFSMMKVLMDGLANHQVGTTGKSCLDCTTIVLHSEFNRDPALTILNPGSTEGTDHGRNGTVILIGAGIKGGIYGGEKRGPTEAKWGSFSDFQFRDPLPVHPDTGAPNVDGIKIGQNSLFPTMMTLFGAEIPPEQKTDWEPLRFVMV